MLFCLLCLYWGALQKAEKNYSSLTVWVVDFDAQIAPYNDGSIQPLVGPLVTDLANRRNSDPSLHLGYVVKSASDFDYNVKSVWKGVYDEHAWAAFIVNSNATALLRS